VRQRAARGRNTGRSGTDAPGDDEDAGVDLWEHQLVGMDADRFGRGER
jgi:hypothetical protein